MTTQTQLMPTGQPIGLERLRTDGGTQLRADGLDQDRVAEYAELYRSGHHLPPVVAYDDGQDIWLADGFHRLAAAGAAGLAEIPADIRPGAHRDALLYALSCNASHGLRRTRRDLQHAIDVALRDDDLGRLTDKALAGLIVCSPATVARHRAELVEQGAIDDHRVRVTERGDEVPVRGEEQAPEEIPGQTQLDTSPPSLLELLELTSDTDTTEGLRLTRGHVRFRGQPLRVFYAALSGEDAHQVEPPWVADSMDERFASRICHELYLPYDDQGVTLVLVDEPIDDLALAQLVLWIASDAEGRWCVGRYDPDRFLFDAVHGLPTSWYRSVLDQVESLLEEAEAQRGEDGAGDRIGRQLYPIWEELDEIRADLANSGPDYLPQLRAMPRDRLTALDQRVCEAGRHLEVPRGDDPPIGLHLRIQGFAGNPSELRIVLDEAHRHIAWSYGASINCSVDDYVDDHTAIHRAIDSYLGSGSRTGGSGGAQPTPPKPLKQRRKELAGKRTKALIEAFCAALREQEISPDTADLWRLVLVFGCPRIRGIYDAQGALRAMPRIPVDGLCEQTAWELLRGSIAGEIAHWLRYTLTDVPDRKLLADLAGLIDYDLDAAWQQACEAHPEPASWAKLKADGTPKPEKKAKKKPEKKAKTEADKPAEHDQSAAPEPTDRTPLQLLEAHCIRIAQTTAGGKTFCRQRDLAEYCQQALLRFGVAGKDIPGPRIIARRLTELGLTKTTTAIGGRKAKAWLGVTVARAIDGNAGSRIPSQVEHDAALAQRAREASS